MLDRQKPPEMLAQRRRVGLRGNAGVTESAVFGLRERPSGGGDPLAIGALTLRGGGDASNLSRMATSAPRARRA
jgi:hypothetical protein